MNHNHIIARMVGNDLKAARLLREGVAYFYGQEDRQRHYARTGSHKCPHCGEYHTKGVYHVFDFEGDFLGTLSVQDVVSVLYEFRKSGVTVGKNPCHWRPQHPGLTLAWEGILSMRDFDIVA